MTSAAKTASPRKAQGSRIPPSRGGMLREAFQLPLGLPPPGSLAEAKKNFLDRLSTGPDGKRFRRYLGSPIRYAGGKSLAVGIITELLPNHVRRVVSPFLGGGSVEVAFAKELGLDVVAYDIFDVLINYWQFQLRQPEKLYRKLKAFVPNRTEYKRVKERLRQHWKKETRLGKLDLAAHYYFNHNTSYGPHFLGWPSSVYLESKRYSAMIDKARNFRAPKLRVGCLSFEKAIARHPNDFLYCDPPYYLDGDSKTFVGMYPHRNFPIHHKGFDHERLRDMLLSHRAGFILSYNDCSTIRQWYRDFEMITPVWQYTFSQGDTRIGENRRRDNNGHYVKKSHELLIWSLPK